MTFSYSGVKAKAEGLIDKYGKSAILRRISRDWDGTLTTTTDYPCTALQIVKRDDPSAGTPAPAAEATIYVQSTVEPSVDDFIVISGVDRLIVSVKALAPAADATVWECIARAPR